MKQNYYDKKDNTMAGPWLSVSDVKNEGNWKDFYTETLMQHMGPFKGGTPDGG